MSSERGGVPEPPSDVSAQPNLNGGLFVFWRPVRYSVSLTAHKKRMRKFSRLLPQYVSFPIVIL